MTSTMLLLGYVLLASTVGARALQTADWPSRAPRLASLAWQSLSVSVVMAVTLGGPSSSLPTRTSAGASHPSLIFVPRLLPGSRGRLHGPQPRSSA